MLTRSFVLFVVFAFAAGLIARANEPEPQLARPALAGFPMEFGEWRGRQEPPFDEKTLAILGVNDYLTRSYRGTDAPAGLYIGYWASQRQGDSIHSPLNCLPGSGWEPLSKSVLAIHVADAATATSSRPIPVNRYVIQKGLDRELVLYWYQSHGRVVASEYLGKIYLVTDAIRLHRTDAALVRVIVHISGEADGEIQAERAGIRFVKSLFPILAAYIPL